MSGKTTTERRKDFHQLIEQAEENFKNNPSAYKRKLGMLAGLGYAYIFGVLIFTLLLIGLCVLGAIHSSVFLLLLIKKKLIIVLLMVFYVLIKALWVKLEAPTGYILSRSEYPKLFKLLDKISKKLKAPKIHEVILTSEFNAAIVQTPRLGIFGWNKNTLILGLSLMMSMNKDEFVSVVAHEYGHLSGNHSVFAGWIYRVRMTWMRIMDAFDQVGGAGHIIFGRFFDWYAPYFNAYSFALARNNEYEADSVAVRLTSKEAFATALSQAHVAPDLIDKYYWSEVEKEVGKTDEINNKIYTGLFQRLKSKPFKQEEKRDLLNKALKETTEHTNTHPCLKDRVSPYTQNFTLPTLPDKSAAEVVFGNKLSEILQDFDHDWASNNEQWWRDRYDYLQKSKEELDKLEEKQKNEELNADELWNLAAWTEELKPNIDALPLYQTFLQQYPDDAGANYAIGRLLLAKDDLSGLEFLDKSMNYHRAVIPACELAYDYFLQKDDKHRAEEYRLRAESHIDLQNKAQLERADLYDKDEFITDELNEEWIDYLRKQLVEMDGLDRIWVCRKKVKIFEDEPVYVFICKAKWHKSMDNLIHKIADTIEGPGAFFVIGNKGEHKKLAKKALEVATEIELY